MTSATDVASFCIHLVIVLKVSLQMGLDRVMDSLLLRMATASTSVNGLKANIMAKESLFWEPELTILCLTKAILN